MPTEIPRTDDGNFKCPTCGATETNSGTSFASRGGVRGHHKQVHGESLAFKTHECAHCDKQFTARISNNRRYCDAECAQDARWKRYREAKETNAD